MTKRLNDTEIWDKEWFLILSTKEKLLVKYLFDKCDCAGIYVPNYTLLNFIFGEPVTREDFANIKQVKMLENGNYFIEDFIEFQYGVNITGLNPNFSVHKGVIKQLQKNGLLTVSKPLDNSCIETVQDKDKDKNKDKNKKLDIYSNKYKVYFEKEYKRIFGQKPYLSQFDCQKVVEISSEYDAEIITIAIEKLKDITFEDINFKPTASWLLKDNNFERVMNGEFDKKSDLSVEKFEY